MQVLEKILYDIEKEIMTKKAVWDSLEKPPYNDFEQSLWAAGMRNAKEIIRKHMNDIPNTNVEEKRLIDANALDEEVMKSFLTIMGNPCQAAVVRECKKSFRRMIDEQPTIYTNADGGWIPCNKRLPEVPEGLEDMYCPEFNVTIKGAKEATTLKYSCDGTWFDDNGNVYDVIAWQRLPEVYKGQA